MSTVAKTLDRLVAADRLLNNTDLPTKERTAVYNLALQHAGLTATVPPRKTTQKIVRRVEKVASSWDPRARADARSITGPVRIALTNQTFNKQKQGAKTHQVISGTKRLLRRQPHLDTNAWEGAVSRIQTDNTVPGDWHYYRSRRGTQRVSAPGALQQVLMRHRRALTRRRTASGSKKTGTRRKRRS